MTMQSTQKGVNILSFPVEIQSSSQKFTKKYDQVQSASTSHSVSLLVKTCYQLNDCKNGK